METLQSRLRRFLNGSPDEISLTLLNSISNFFLPELRTAGEHKLDRLVFLGTHAVIQTVGTHLFNKTGVAATKFYFESFVDGAEDHLQFSRIAKLIHDLRNVLAHQWLSSQAHDYAIDYRIDKGWVHGPDGIHINPDIYLSQFLRGFAAEGRIWRYRDLLTDRDRQVAKYRYIANWLGVAKSDPVHRAVDALSMSTDADFTRMERQVHDLIRDRHLGDPKLNGRGHG